MGKKKEQEEEEEDEFPECVRVCNPCKICLQSVDDESGLQCQGACEAWVHYECLNYTPGKISDIQTGLISVICPCPDCKTKIPREYLNDPPFSCDNIMCPANNPPSCVEPTCQANEVSRRLPPKCPPINTLRQCDAAVCRAHSREPTSYATPLDDPCMQGFTVKTYCGDLVGKEHVIPPKPTSMLANMPTSMPANMGACGGGSMQNDVMQQMCKTVGDLARELNSLLANLKANQGGAQGGPQGVGGGMRGCGGPIPVLKTGGGTDQGNLKVLQGCQGGPGGACGQNPQAATNKQQCTGGCGHAGEVKCSQPCHCPSNPVKRC